MQALNSLFDQKWIDRSGRAMSSVSAESTQKMYSFHVDSASVYRNIGRPSHIS
jgi:hypothetical protein